MFPRRPLLLILLILIAAIAVGDRFVPYGPFVRPPQWSRDAITRQGVVTRQPVRTERSTRLVLRLTDSGAEVQVTLPDTTPFTAGDIVVFHAVITEPRNAGNPGEVDYAAYLRHQGVTGTAFCPPGNWRKVGTADRPLLRERMLRLRSHLVATYADHLDGPALAILAAMTLGDKSGIDRSTRELYSRTGSSHILALSGLHLSILVSLLSLLLRPLQRRWGPWSRQLSCLLTLCFVWIFVLLAALPVSLVRAATMLTIVLLMQCLHHRAPPFHALIVALLLMLLVSPQQLFDVGLQLSALSVAAIQFLPLLSGQRTDLVGSGQRYTGFVARLRTRSYRYRVRWQSWSLRHAPWLQRPVRVAVGFFGSLVLVSLAAQLATLPLIAHYFGTVSLVGSLTSCIVIPLTMLLLTGSLLFFLLVPLRGLLALCLSGGVEMLHAFLGAVAVLPGASCNVSLTWWGVVGCYATMAVAGWTVWRLRRAPRHWLRPVAVVIATVFVSLAAERVAVNRPSVQLVAYNRPQTMELHLVTTAGDSIITRLADDGRHVAGHTVVHYGHTMAVVNHRFPNVHDITLPPPMEVDAVLLSRGAAGHLSDVLLRYRPAIVVLDGCLSDYYRRRFTEETLAAGLPLYDISRQGAFVLP